ncbi:MAG TPA: SpoIIE family protein phosphatase [Candidatus Hydrogenedentes bacterium]|nr:SpoIIE family protein phosphatase [Candidatus Hydrogenedentota bacterium]
MKKRSDKKPIVKMPRPQTAPQPRRAEKTTRARMQELEGLNAALELRERAMAVSDEGISISDIRRPDNPLIYVNDGFLRLTGFTREEVLNRNCRFLQGPGTSPEMLHELRKAIEERRSFIGEVLNYRKDGTPFWNRLSLTPLKDENGTVTHYVGIQSDITDRVRAEEELQRALEALSDANQKLAETNRRLKQSLGAAAKIQQSLLPDSMPVFKGIRFGWRLHPCEELAGDTLNVFRLDDAHVGLYLLDVMGHGVAAALLAVSVSRMLSSTAQPSSFFWERRGSAAEYSLTPPAEVANRLNALFPWEPETGQFFTLVYGILDVRDGLFRYVSAGHPSLLHITETAARELPLGEGLPIGLSNTSYQEQQVIVQPGERLIIYSDGVSEVMNDQGEIFGTKRLMHRLAGLHALPVNETLDRLFELLVDWHGDDRFSDDVSIVALGRAPGKPA